MDTWSRLQVERSGDKFVIRKGDKISRPISYEQLFSIGHSLFTDGKPRAAEDAFQALVDVRGRGVRAKIMLARCKAELEKYEECENIVHSLFNDGNEPAAEKLQTAFVYHSIGMIDEAIQELIKVVNKYKDLPTACLYLGDLYNEAGDLAMAVRCWKMAIGRDRDGGSVAMTARKQIARINEHAKRKPGRRKPVMVGRS